MERQSDPKGNPPLASQRWSGGKGGGGGGDPQGQGGGQGSLWVRSAVGGWVGGSGGGRDGADTLGEKAFWGKKNDGKNQ